MPYDYREMRWQHREGVYPDCLWDVLEVVGRETGHTPEEAIVLIVSYAMNDLCQKRRSDDITEATMHLHLFVQQWIRHEWPEEWAAARGAPASAFGGDRRTDGDDTRKEWWDE